MEINRENTSRESGFNHDTQVVGISLGHVCFLHRKGEKKNIQHETSEITWVKSDRARWRKKKEKLEKKKKFFLIWFENFHIFFSSVWFNLFIFSFDIAPTVFPFFFNFFKVHAVEFHGCFLPRRDRVFRLLGKRVPSSHMEKKTGNKKANKPKKRKKNRLFLLLWLLTRTVAPQPTVTDRFDGLLRWFRPCQQHNWGGRRSVLDPMWTKESDSTKDGNIRKRKSFLDNGQKISIHGRKLLQSTIKRPNGFMVKSAERCRK